MKTTNVLALAAALGFGGMTFATSTADARQGWGGAGGFSGNFGGGAGRGWSGGNFSGGVNRGYSGGNFSGPRVAAPRFSSPRAGNFSNSNRSGRWAGNNNWSGGKWSGKHSGNWRHHRRHFRGYPYFYAAPFVAGAYYYGSYGNCDWLYDRAVTTGSSYWWSRYNECVYDY